MRSRVLLAASAALSAFFLALLGFTLAVPTAALLVLTVIGLVVGAVGGQALLWMRATASRVARIDNRVEAMRSTGDRRHEVLLKAFRDNRANVNEAKAAAHRAEVALNPQALHTALQGDFKALGQRHAQDLRELRQQFVDKLDDQVALLEDYQQLQRLVPMPLPMPRPGTWAASEDYLLWLAGFVLERRPHTVIDLGSGQSSVWMAGAMRQAGYAGKVIAIDHDEGFAAQTRALAQRQGVAEWIDVRVAPLTAHVIDGREALWYDAAAFEDLEQVGLLSVDGPPGAGQSEARWPALPLLRQTLAPGAVVVLDDMIRVDEQTIAEDWHRRYPEFSVERLDFEKGAAVFSLTERA